MLLGGLQIRTANFPDLDNFVWLFELHPGPLYMLPSYVIQNNEY